MREENMRDVRRREEEAVAKRQVAIEEADAEWRASNAEHNRKLDEAWKKYAEDIQACDRLAKRITERDAERESKK